MTPLPKRKFSTRRQGKGRANKIKSLPKLVICKNCGKKKIPHQQCKNCGK